MTFKLSVVVRFYAYVSVAAYVAILGANVALADTRDTARELAAKGRAAYNLGHYDEAAHFYEDAYRAAEDPALLFNLGQTYRLAGQPDKAIGVYRAYLRTAQPDDETRERLTRKIDELELERSKQPPSAPQPLPTTSHVAPPMPTPEVHTAAKAADVGESPFYQRWWFWTGAGVVAVAVASALILSNHGSTKVDCYDITPCGVLR